VSASDAQPIAPQNLDAEESVLGGMMLSAGAIKAARDVLGSDGADFYRGSHARIYRAALALHDRGEPADAVMLAAELERRGELAEVGGTMRIHELAALVPAASNAGHYARLVVEAARRRELDRLGLELRMTAANGGALTLELRERMGEALRVVDPASPTALRLVSGAEFILDAPKDVPAVWGGASGTVAWAQGEGFMLVGPDGVGKTTLAQQLTLGLIGLRRRVLGWRVVTLDRPVLYLAADRPSQASRSFARMVTEEHRAILQERLIVWKGPLPFNVVEQPASLARFARERDAGAVVIDSLKDIAIELSRDEVGGRVNEALQELVVEGIEVCALHHQRKAKQDGSKPTKLADVYGSRWLTAGMGSVVLLWGEPGDLVVDFRHLKQPAEEIVALKVLHDHERGESRVYEQVDLLELVTVAATEGLTAERAAAVMFGTEAPGANEVEKARRQLERLVRGDLIRKEGAKPHPVRYLRKEGA
jgi:replicative DNA helicase